MLNRNKQETEEDLILQLLQDYHQSSLDGWGQNHAIIVLPMGVGPLGGGGGPQAEEGGLRAEEGHHLPPPGNKGRQQRSLHNKSSHKIKL